MPVGCVVNFFGSGCIWLLALLLVNFLYGLQEDGTIPHPMVCISLVEHAIKRSILVSTPTSASI
jgi:hypothetical protein